MKEQSVLTHNEAAHNCDDHYIGRCHSSVTPHNIISYVSTEINVNANSCVCISREGAEMKAFKLSVDVYDSEKILNHEM